MLSGKNIVIFSPQRWSHLYVSKHHYAMELAKNNNVWFISAPDEGIGKGYSVRNFDLVPRLKLVDYRILLPGIFKFKAPRLYKKVTERALGKLISRIAGKVDWCIDFGCYQFFNSLDFIKADTKVYFPVDDFGDLLPMDRGAQKIFSVSTIIVEKFRRAGLDCHFINHGLAQVFADKAEIRLSNENFGNIGRTLKFGYSGNIFIRFLDIPVLKNIISQHPDIEFHFFGNKNFDPSNDTQKQWSDFLQTASNVKLRGFMPPEDLASASEEMDGFLLCYKPDYKDYHAENSHKVFEYLSSGKVLVSTYLSLYEGNTLICMSPKDRNEDLPKLFAKVVEQIEQWN
ncbi:MAG TPA: hypothetical protein VGD17_04430, partial [Chitinophagaceae bacterium]